MYNDYIISKLNTGAVVESVYTDLVRAFDMVNIDLLIRKLSAYGISGCLLKLFKSFLSDRKQFVKIKGFISVIFGVLSGVGQGMHLGTIMFIIFINDFQTKIKYSKIIYFADDTKIFREILSLKSMGWSVMIKNVSQ